MEKIQKKTQKSKELVKLLYKNDKGEPFELTDGQVEIFDSIFKKKYPRVHIQTPTRYGKSHTIAMAILARASTFPEKWAIVAGNKDKAGIIMAYVIQHIFDNEYTRQRFVLNKGESEENIRRYKNKDRVNFKLENGLLGEVFITTAEGALGFGAPNVVEDESALISEKDHALVMRMLGDQPDNFICKVGNPWESEHFRSSFQDDNYHKIVIDYQQGVREGRFTSAYIDEMRKQPFFDVLYECKFPPLGIIDEKGWVPLLTKDEIDRAMIEDGEGFGINKLGVDVAGGGRNFSVIVQRHNNLARIIHKTKESDTMKLAEMVISLDKNTKRTGIFVDSVGIGKGCYDILSRQVVGVWPINGGEKPTDIYSEAEYVNLRAQLYWKLRKWILGGGKLVKSDDWYQLTKLKYRTKLEGTKGKMAIISKEDLLKEGIDSPDVADALMMTFRTDDIPDIFQGLSREEVEDLNYRIKQEAGDFNILENL
jgi:hypothetical protein